MCKNIDLDKGQLLYYPSNRLISFAQGNAERITIITYLVHDIKLTT